MCQAMHSSYILRVAIIVLINRCVYILWHAATDALISDVELNVSQHTILSIYAYLCVYVFYQE